MSVRIHAADLRDAARQSVAIRADAEGRGEQAPEVLLDIEVVIAPRVSAAFHALSSLPAPPMGVHYVGTARGLAGLIADVQRLGIADGVVILTAAADSVVGLLLDEMAVGLGSGRQRVAA